MDLGQWLRSLGLERYEAAFRENAIDDTVLPSLTAEDLKDLGVGLVGHRRKLLEAIMAVRADESSRASASDTLPATGIRVKDAAERRHVTVMFSDLVGSTALSARIDPEDLREVISAYQNCVAESVRRFGGFVAKYMGDGVLIYFGYPQAHEDDAERAVRAGLELVAAVSRLKTHAPLQTRVGIGTGLVVVGDLIGSGASQEQAIIGETPNLAARLQGITEPNTVVIAEGTRKLLGNLFELEDLGPKALKGIVGPAHAWVALRPSSVESRFEALRSTGLAELVGREKELEVLLRQWSNAKAAGGQVVLLSGEAGIGKSRLTAALMEERITAEPHTRLRYFCSPQHTDSALHPIIAQMERAASLSRDDGPSTRLDKLDATLAPTGTSVEDMALFAEMLSIPNDGRYPALDLVPQKRRQRTLDALIAQVAYLAGRQPVLLVFEDVHWIDPTSLEALGRLVDRVQTLPALLVATFRPDFSAPWTGLAHVTSLTLSRIGKQDAAEIIARLAGNKELTGDLVGEIIDRTDGIPLFVEEMTKAVLEAESEGGGRRTGAAVPSPVIAVPESLHASLMARLDRLGPAKEVVQIGAAIGREFSYELIAGVALKGDVELQGSLDRFVSAGLGFCRGVSPNDTFVFKHALVRDAAYSTLLRGQRQQLHGRIAAVLEHDFPEVVKNQPEALARHCAEAGLFAEAIGHYLSASRRATASSNNIEASRHVANGLALLEKLPADAPRAELHYRLMMGGWWWSA
jgi:class 3 adenylate cyclase